MKTLDDILKAAEEAVISKPRCGDSCHCVNHAAVRHRYAALAVNNADKLARALKLVVRRLEGNIGSPDLSMHNQSLYLVRQIERILEGEQ